MLDVYMTPNQQREYQALRNAEHNARQLAARAPTTANICNLGLAANARVEYLARMAANDCDENGY